MTRRERERRYEEAQHEATVAALPQRTAHALYALIEASRTLKMPVTAAEVCVFDRWALNVRSTAQALRNATTLGYCARAGGLWIAANSALELYPALEDRFLKETAE